MSISSYKQIISSKFTLTPSQLREIEIINQNTKTVAEMLDRQLTNEDNGREVGSANYIINSTHYMIKAKALQKNYFLPILNEESVEPIRPQNFVQYSLKKQDIIISKDSNIGEVILLDKDYPNHMMSGALYKLPASKNKFYLFAFLKDGYFLDQLDVMVPKGSTIRHAKTLFLQCKIPFPNQNEKQVIAAIEDIVINIFDKESKIREKMKLINELIHHEIISNQKQSGSDSISISFSDLMESKRLDTGLYGSSFKKIHKLIRNYSRGYYFIDENNIKSGSTPSKRILSSNEDLSYKWVTPTIINDYGVFETIESINCKSNNLNKNALLLVNRTSKGGVGEYVGMSLFYDIKTYGKGQHNQGIYRVVNYDDKQLMIMGMFLNCEMMRKYCASISIGSKMKEIKLNQFTQIPFPKFSSDFVDSLVSLYSNSVPKSVVKNYIHDELEWNKQAGILELSISLKHEKDKLAKALKDIKNDIAVDISALFIRK